jgi:hypothetical protein
LLPLNMNILRRGCAASLPRARLRQLNQAHDSSNKPGNPFITPRRLKLKQFAVTGRF